MASPLGIVHIIPALNLRPVWATNFVQIIPAPNLRPVWATNFGQKLNHISSIRAPNLRSVWTANLDQELNYISSIYKHYPNIAVDIEFPGTVVQPPSHMSKGPLVHYPTLRENVNMLKIIQLGLTFFDDHGKYCPITWEFNFQFDLDVDDYSDDSIEFLWQNGINFDALQQHGIRHDVFVTSLFGKHMFLFDGSHRWVTFSGAYDIAYLLKLFSCQDLPDLQNDFFKLLDVYFPSRCDVKYMTKFGCHIYGSLSNVAQSLGVEKNGLCHHAGFDSFITACVFDKLKEKDHLLDSYGGVIYGLRQDSNDSL